MTGNAVAESFFSHLKKEGFKHQIYRTREEAKSDVFDYIESFYSSLKSFDLLGLLAFEQLRTGS